ncbi:MAG: hypothetical protein OEQ53_13005 [Saprospiraceae bacterium]|nr:hypothetical protein [Saprospiraceae bacterium]
MKKFTTVLAISLLSFSVAMAQDYTMFMTIELDPAPGKALELEKGVKIHNEKYHKDGSTKGYLWSVLSGPRAGQYVWGQGPMTWESMDSGLSEEHAADWEKNVAAHCKYVGNFIYMRRDDKRSYNPENQVTAPKIIAKIFTVTGNRGALLDALDEIGKVFKAKKYAQARRVYASVFNLKNKQEVALIYPFDSFKMFETTTGLPAGFRQDFEEINGFGSWQRLVTDPINENSDGFFDEVRVLVE